MPIAEQGYTHWEGRLDVRRRPWRPIARLGIRLAFKRKFFKFVLGMAFLPSLFFAAAVYISERIEDFKDMFQNVDRFLKVDPDFFKTFYTSSWLLFWMLIIMVLAGAGLIADDLRHNALQLYFARPLRKKDYLQGKVFTLSFFLLLLTLVPGLLFILLKLIFSGSFKFLADYPWLPFSVVGWSFAAAGFFSLYTLALSSLSRNRRYASILLIAVYFLSDIFFAIFFGIFRDPYFALISLKSNLQQVACALLGAKPMFNVPWGYSAGVLAVLAVLAGCFLVRKVKGAEVIK
jgi:ABC-type transport system involved in multi-copper enzyme maturation permease subunit